MLSTPLIKIKNQKADVIVIDDFLENPFDHREFALSLEYEKKGSYGLRSKHSYPYLEYRDMFEEILGRSIVSWAAGVNGCYQWCNKDQDIVFHVDDQSFAAVLYLTPDAPPAAGTSFWKSKNSLARLSGPGTDIARTFGPKGEHLKDPDQWELVDTVGNVFNRLVLFNSKLIHSASSYFGDTVHDSRLFQIFFFNLE